MRHGESNSHRELRANSRERRFIHTTPTVTKIALGGKFAQNDLGAPVPREPGGGGDVTKAALKGAKCEALIVETLRADPVKRAQIGVDRNVEISEAPSVDGCAFPWNTT
jgi:hypothetical protein